MLCQRFIREPHRTALPELCFWLAVLGSSVEEPQDLAGGFCSVEDGASGGSKKHYWWLTSKQRTEVVFRMSFHILLILSPNFRYNFIYLSWILEHTLIVPD